MADTEREFFRSVTGREPPAKRVKKLDIIAGRRSAKHSVASNETQHSKLEQTANMAGWARQRLRRRRPQ
jgi:hypothetical protein